MRLTASIIILTSLVYSCKDRPYTDREDQLFPPKAENKVAGDSMENIRALQKELSDAFTMVVKVFPEDSASLYRFYFEGHPAKEEEKVFTQIERLRALTLTESIDRYNAVGI